MSMLTSAVVSVGGPSPVNADYTALNVAAASGTGATVTDATGLGCSTGLTFDLTAWSAGTSTGLLISVQQSLDGINNWTTIWMERFTATGQAYMPPMPIWGRRRITWAHISGSATTATLNVTATHFQAVFPIQRRFLDYTPGVGSGTLVLNTLTPLYDFQGCSNITVAMNHGTATGAGTLAFYGAIDASTLALSPAFSQSLGTSAACRLNGANIVNRPDLPRFWRVQCISAGTSQLMNYLELYGKVQ